MIPGTLKMDKLVSQVWPGFETGFVDLRFRQETFCLLHDSLWQGHLVLRSVLRGSSVCAGFLVSRFLSSCKFKNLAISDRMRRQVESGHRKTPSRSTNGEQEQANSIVLD